MSGATTNKDIADKMGIVDQVAKNYMKRLMEAAGVDDRTALALAIVRSDMERMLREEFEAKER